MQACGSVMKVHKHSWRNEGMCKSQHWHFCRSSENQPLRTQRHTIPVSWLSLQVQGQASKTLNLWSVISQRMKKAKANILGDACVVSLNGQTTSLVLAKWRSVREKTLKCRRNHTSYPSAGNSGAWILTCLHTLPQLESTFTFPLAILQGPLNIFLYSVNLVRFSV